MKMCDRLGCLQVGCTWDEDDTRRMQVTRRKIKEDELDQLNLDDYLASGSDSDAGQSLTSLMIITHQQLYVDPVTKSTSLTCACTFPVDTLFCGRD